MHTCTHTYTHTHTHTHTQGEGQEAEKGASDDGELLRVRIAGVAGQHSAFAFERPVPPPYSVMDSWTVADV